MHLPVKVEHSLSYNLSRDNISSSFEETMTFSLRTACPRYAFLYFFASKCNLNFQNLSDKKAVKIQIYHKKYHNISGLFLNL